MPRTVADPAPLLLDTSTAVALLVVGHEHHAATYAALADRELGLAGHAAFETFSVLTRLPAPSRVSPTAASQLLTANFPHTRFLGGRAAGRLLGELPRHGLAGGSTYDALVAAVAVEHGLTLATRDRRALATYRAIGADLLVL